MLSYEVDILEFTLSVMVNTDPGFYGIMGPVFGSREIEKELGGKVYDDQDRVWFVARHEGSLAGVCSYETKSKKAYLKSDYVYPEFRGQGLWNKLCDMRERAAFEHVDELVVTAKGEHKDIWLKRGFEETGKRGSYVTMRKVRA